MSISHQAKKFSENAAMSYNVSVIPNDFNITTIFSLINSGAISMPVFQRNYVWDRKRASRFIESLILGLPVPQVFLYQRALNKFLVVDGQQRLLSVYYFIKQRFPLSEKRAELRKIFDANNGIPDAVLSDDAYFQDFKLQFPKTEEGGKNPLEGLKYSTLGLSTVGLYDSFEYMTIRCMAIRQNDPNGDDSAVFEIFSRLNTGGVNLTNQEIRACLYYSDFYRMICRLNQNSIWRELFGKPEDCKFRDTDIILRSFALLCDGERYNGSMNAFINRYAREAMNYSSDDVAYLYNLFASFLEACRDLPRELFTTKKGELNAALFDSVFAVAAGRCFKGRTLITNKLQQESISRLRADPEFAESVTHSTSHTKNVARRIEIAREYLQ